jgi:endonuclease-3
VVLGVAYHTAEGVVVDTHVKRLSARLGLTQHIDPVKVERDLMAALPRKSWIQFSHLLIYHGRKICTARNPKCEACPLQDICPSAGIAG